MAYLRPPFSIPFLFQPSLYHNFPRPSPPRGLTSYPRQPGKQLPLRVLLQRSGVECNHRPRWALVPGGHRRRDGGAGLIHLAMAVVHDVVGDRLALSDRWCKP